MFGDDTKSLEEDLGYARAENSKLRQLVNDACAIAYQLRTGDAAGMWRDKTLLDIELKRILTEARLMDVK